MNQFVNSHNNVGNEQNNSKVSHYPSVVRKKLFVIAVNNNCGNKKDAWYEEERHIDPVQKDNSRFTLNRMSQGLTVDCAFG